MAEEDQKMDVEAPVADEAAPAEAAPIEYDVFTAVQEVLKKALIHDGLKRGLHECAKALTKREARLALLAEDCDHPEYIKLVQALCDDGGISLLKVPGRKQLGEWCGLCKIDQEGKARKVVNCSCAVITDFGENSAALDYLLKEIKSE